MTNLLPLVPPRLAARSIAAFAAFAAPALVGTAHEALAGPSPVQSIDPAGVDTPARRAAGSQLVQRFGSPRTDETLARMERLGKDGPRGAARLADLERELHEQAMRALVSDGLRTAARGEALGVLRALRSPAELRAAARVLEGEGVRANLVASEHDVRAAFFESLAREPEAGHAILVRHAITGDDRVSDSARRTLPDGLSRQALALVEEALRSSRELHINRAAMIAGAHAAAGLIPALIDAQVSERAATGRGDEAWIAIGRRTAYVAGYVPVLGGGSGALQPIPGIVYEGSLLRIMESAVMIYRTEVHRSLAMVIERETGEPAPPLGYDRERWLAWMRDEFPSRAEAYQARMLEERVLQEAVRRVPARDDA